MNVSPLKLCLVTQPGQDCLESSVSLILQSIKGGVTSVQLRHKTQDPSLTRDLARALIAQLRPLTIPLILNDHVDLAKEVDADGIHLGQSDCSPIEARQILGPNKLIGWSVETFEQLEQANECSCIDYIAASAVFLSQTKTNCKTIWGLEGLKKIAQHSIHPVIAIGGINVGNVRSVMKAGAAGVAVISAIYDHPQPEQAAQSLIQEINKGISYVSAD